MTTICRPWITLRNGRVLYATECGKKVFCFDVAEEKDSAEYAKSPSTRKSEDEEIAKDEKE